jgi:hypothetical protein
MTKGGAHWGEAVARRIGVGGAVNFTPARVGQTLHIPCTRGHIVDFYVNARMPPEAIAKKMMQKGWTVGSHLLCPKHSRKPKKAANDAPQQHEEEEIMVTPTPPAPKPPAPTVAAREARRLAIAGLDEGYDITNERYKSGWSDKKIADECGIGEAAVAKLREELYGPLGEPAELVALRSELAALDKKGDAIAADLLELGKEAKTLKGRFETLCRKNGWPV